MFQRARIQLTAWYTLALTIVLLVAGGLTYGLVLDSLDGDITSALNGAVAELRSLDQALLVSSPTVGPPRTPQPTPTPDPTAGDEDDDHDDDDDDEDNSGTGNSDDRDDDPTPGPGGAIAALPSDVFYVTATLTGRVLANPRSVNLQGVDLAHVAAEADRETETVSAQSGTYRMSAYNSGQTLDGDPIWVFVGHDLRRRDRDLATLLRTLLLGGGVGVALSIAGGYWLSGRAMNPIRQSLESQRRFVSDASHELRTPLAVLRANNELLQRHPEQSIAENLEQVDAIGEETEHMARLVDDLLTLARADEGRLLGARDLVDAGEIAQSVARDMQPLARARSIELSHDVRPGLVEGDAQRLRQLVLILVDNAVKYTPTGGHVDVSCGRSGRWVVISVADSGPGIPPEAQRSVFERFTRLEAGRSRVESGGTGLGLAIAHEIATAHGGQLTVMNRPTGGALFTLRLRASG